eukprot:Amastigsp_a680660_16.p2 type:complete len:253 gc:universal Amastigsp_a680660_16:835-77(-)
MSTIPRLIGRFRFRRRCIVGRRRRRCDWTPSEARSSGSPSTCTCPVLSRTFKASSTASSRRASPRTSCSRRHSSIFRSRRMRCTRGRRLRLRLCRRRAGRWVTATASLRRHPWAALRLCSARLWRVTPCSRRWAGATVPRSRRLLISPRRLRLRPSRSPSRPTRRGFVALARLKPTWAHPSSGRTLTRPLSSRCLSMGASLLCTCRSCCGTGSSRHGTTCSSAKPCFRPRTCSRTSSRISSRISSLRTSPLQ